MSEFKAKLNFFTGTLQLVPTNVVLSYKPGVATQASLPLTGNAKGDARIANDTGHLYVWNIEATSGLLTDWVDAGDIIDLTWAAISGKPSSSVTDIDDAVSKRHATTVQFNKTTAAEISALTDKATPVDADVVLAEDSAAGTVFSKIKITWSNIKATLKTYFDGLYDAIGAATSAINGHKDLSTGVHGVGAGTIAKVTDIATDSNLSVAAQDAVSKRHSQGTDVGLDTGGTNPVTAATIKGHVDSTSNPHSTTASQVGALANVSEDTTPELGGELDCGAHSVGFTQQTITSIAGAATIDWKLSNKAKITLSEATTFTFTAPTKPCSLLLLMVQDGAGGRTVVFPGTVKWANGIQPSWNTGINKINMMSLYFDGSVYYCTGSINFA